MWQDFLNRPWVKRLRGSRVFFLGKRLYERYIDDDVGGLAAEATYFLILALVPFLIFLLNVILYFAASQLEMVLHLLDYLPADTQLSLEPIILDIINARSTTILSIGLIFALWSSSKGVTTLIRATDQAFGTNKNLQSYVRVKVKSVLFTLLIVGTMLGALGVSVFGNAVVHGLANVFELDPRFLAWWDAGKLSIPFVAMVLALSMFYRYAPGFKRDDEGRTPWAYTLTSSTLVTGLWLLMTAGYGYYVGNIAHMGSTYGPLVGLMILFIWLNLTATIFIMGAEFIAAYSEMRLYFSGRNYDSIGKL